MGTPRALENQTFFAVGGGGTGKENLRKDSSRIWGKKKENHVEDQDMDP